MISRAIVSSIVDANHVKVRIPRVNKVEGAVGATPINELSTSIICSPCGCSPRLRVGDTVIVGYEDDDNGTPVILGLIFNSKNNSIGDYNTDSLKVNVDCKLPNNTYIGELTPHNLNTLFGIRDNIQVQIDTITENLNILTKIVKQLYAQVNPANNLYPPYTP